jgi:hypothetical protein
MTIADLAEVLEVTEQDVQAIESGGRGLALAEMQALCSVTGLRTDQVLFGDSGAGVLLRAEGGADVARVVARVERAFEDLLYVESLVEA